MKRQQILLERFLSLIQSGQRPKILTPIQMLSRLPITLTQLKEGNNSEKIKNEISIKVWLTLLKTWKQSL